jgi:hypothetical protein
LPRECESSIWWLPRRIKPRLPKASPRLLERKGPPCLSSAITATGISVTPKPTARFAAPQRPSIPIDMEWGLPLP